MSTFACLSKPSPAGHCPFWQPCPKNGGLHVHWPVPLAEVHVKPVRFFARRLLLASASSSQTPGQASKHHEVLLYHTSPNKQTPGGTVRTHHQISHISSIVGYRWPLIMHCVPPFLKPNFLRNTAWKKSYESAFTTFSYCLLGSRVMRGRMGLSKSTLLRKTSDHV